MLISILFERTIVVLEVVHDVRTTQSCCTDQLAYPQCLQAAGFGHNFDMMCSGASYVPRSANAVDVLAVRQVKQGTETAWSRTGELCFRHCRIVLYKSLLFI